MLRSAKIGVRLGVAMGLCLATSVVIAALGYSGIARVSDMTASMLERAAASAAEMELTNVELHESLIESLPVPDASIDVVISNGVIDLVPETFLIAGEPPPGTAVILKLRLIPRIVQASVRSKNFINHGPGVTRDVVRGEAAPKIGDGAIRHLADDHRLIFAS